MLSGEINCWMSLFYYKSKPFFFLNSLDRKSYRWIIINIKYLFILFFIFIFKLYLKFKMILNYINRTTIPTSFDRSRPSMTFPSKPYLCPHPNKIIIVIKNNTWNLSPKRKLTLKITKISQYFSCDEDS